MSSSGSGDKAGKNSVSDEIKQMIKDHKVMVFSKTYCTSEFYLKNGQ